MVITLGSDLESALKIAAQRQGVAPELLALNTLSERFLAAEVPSPSDEWERQLLGLAKDCGISLTNSALNREAIYE